MNWSLIILGLVALSSLAYAENSYLVIVPKLLKVGYDNQFSVFIAAASQPVEVKYLLTVGQKRVDGKISVNAGETRNATIALPAEFPVGAGEITITGTGGVQFEDKRDIIVYDNRHVILVQTSASTYRPSDVMSFRVVVTTEELTPVEKGEALIEVYDAALKLIGSFPRVPITSGMTETINFPIAINCNMGTWLVSATVGNTTSSVEVLIATPVTPSFDLKAIFQRFILRTEKFLRGVIEIDSDNNVPIFGRGLIAIGTITEEDVKRMMKEQQEERQKPKTTMKETEQEWRKWKSQPLDISGRVEINYDLMSQFNIDLTKAVAIRVYIRITELASGQDRFIEHVIPIFTRDVVYDIRPLEFEAGIKNEFQILAKRPDGKPTTMEDMIVTVTMMMGNEQGKVQEEKSVEIKDFYTRGRNDIGLFNMEIPENCMGLLMTITPLGADGKVRGYRTHTVPLMPSPRRAPRNGKLTIELTASTVAPVTNDPKAPVVSTQISTVGRTSNFYIQLLPYKTVEKFEPLPMSYIVMTNGRITLSGQFNIQPTKECQSKAPRTIQPEGQQPPTCVFNGTLPIAITRAMLPYSTLLVYTFQPSFGFNVAESYRFSVGGLFKSSLALNATVVPFTSTSNIAEESDEDNYGSSEQMDTPDMQISGKAQDKTRIQLGFTGAPGSMVGLNVIEYDGVMQGLSGEITKERVLQYLTAYEQVPIVGMPTKSQGTEKTMQPRSVKVEKDSDEDHEDFTTMKPESITTMKTSTDKEFVPRGVVSEKLEQENMDNEEMGYKLRYPIEKLVFGLETSRTQKPIEGDDVYTTSSMERFYGSSSNAQSSASHYRRKSMKSLNQYDVTVNDNDFVVATSMPLIFEADRRAESMESSKEQKSMDDEVEQPNEVDQSRVHGSQSWYEKLNSKLSTFSQEAFTFMQSGLSIVSDFQTLQIPSDMRRLNLTKLFSRYRQQSNMIDESLFTDRDDARQVLESYLLESDASMTPPMIMLEEQARLGYYRSVFFNTSRIESTGTGKVVLPRTKPYSTWLATGFSLHSTSGLAIAQPIRLPTNQGLFILANFPDQVQIGEHVLLAYGVNNYLGKDLTNVVIRIRGSADFDLVEPNKPERVLSTNGKDYTITIPSFKTLGAETRNITVVPKRAGIMKIVMEVESEFGGDYEVLTTYVRESGIQRKQMYTRIYDLTEEKKPSNPIVFKVEQSPFLRSVRFSVSGTGLDRLIQRYALETNNLIGIDRTLIRLWRQIGLRRYLNETNQIGSLMDVFAMTNLTMSLEELQLYSDYNGSYSFISDEGLEQSSFYLTTLSFGAMLSPFMPVHDNVALNRTLTWLLSHQREDGSFDYEGPCYHYRFCSGEFRRESLTALFLHAVARDNITQFFPDYIYRQLFTTEASPVMRAFRYLEKRIEAVKPCMLTLSLVELALYQSQYATPELRAKIESFVRARQLTVVPEDGSKYFKYANERVTYDDQLLVNALTLSLYASFGDYRTTSQMARWIVQQIQRYPYHDTLLDAVFCTKAWIQTDLLFRRQVGAEKFAVTVDVSADNGEKQQFKIDQSNMDVTQKLRFKMPVKEISYSVSGNGLAAIQIRSVYVEKQQQPTTEQIPFQLTNEMTPKSWLNEIEAKTCLTYTPTAKELKVKETFNRTVVIAVQLPTATRVNLRQIGFFLSRVPYVMYFTYLENLNTINFFLNVPSTIYGKPICLPWLFERSSFVSTWQPIQIRAYDYLQQDTQLFRLFPVQFQPNLVGYPFVEAVHKARPTIEQLAAMQKQQKP